VLGGGGACCLATGEAVEHSVALLAVYQTVLITHAHVITLCIMTMSFPEVGPSWFSALFYAALSASIRAHELLFEVLDLLFGWAYSTDLP